MAQEHFARVPEETKLRESPTESRQECESSPHPSYHAILRLQRTLGNRRVGELIKAKRLTPEGRILPVQQIAAPPRPTQARALQRFSGFEHEELGNATGATIDLGHGVVLTWGEVVAIAGDEYGSVDELRAAVATPAGRQQLWGRLHHDGVRGPIPASLPVESEHDHSNARYYDLLLHNLSHFAGGGSAVETWRAHHREALLAAALSGLNDNAALWQRAQLTEAFGQHFLTDSFSAGHVRTPRAAIMGWYQTDFAPRLLDRFVAQARQRVVRAIVDDIHSQMRTPRWAIDAALNASLAVLVGALELLFRRFFEEMLGLGIGGAVSGALHDDDNARGLWVSSEAHPEPWRTYGDDHLKCSDIGRAQAESAVLTAREQLVQAQYLGRTRRTYRGSPPPAPGRITPANVPGVVHFELNSSVLDGENARSLQHAADYLLAHPEQRVDIVGHTCPLGSDRDNYGLGMRRAEAVADWLMSHGVDAMRTSTSSAGESQLIDTAVSGYPVNRRAELHYRTQTEEPPDSDWIEGALASQIGPPPYRAVERFVPHEVPGANRPQEDWHWGSLTSAMTAQVDRWAVHYVTNFEEGLGRNHVLDPLVVPLPDLDLPAGPGAPPASLRPITVHPRPAVEAMLGEIIADPTGLIGRMAGEPAANRSTIPLPPPGPCPPEIPKTPL